MSDNIGVQSSQTSTHTVATDEVSLGGSIVHVQRVKLLASEEASAADLSRAEDTAHTTGDHGVPAAVVRQDSATSLAGTSGDYTFLITDSTGRLWVSTELPDAAALADAAANPTTVIVGAGAMCYNGATWDRVRGDTTNGLDVDVTRVIPGTSATHLGKAVDGAAGATDTGVASLVVRDDVLATLTPADGDYTLLRVDAQGRLWSQAAIAGDAIVVAGAGLTPKYAKIDSAGSGNNTLIAAVVSKKIRVLSVALVAAGAVTATFQDGAGGTALTGAMSLITGVPVNLPFSPVGHFEGSTNTLLNLSLSGAVQVSGTICYVEV